DLAALTIGVRGGAVAVPLRRAVTEQHLENAGAGIGDVLVAVAGEGAGARMINDLRFLDAAEVAQRCGGGGMEDKRSKQCAQHQGAAKEGGIFHGIIIFSPRSGGKKESQNGDGERSGKTNARSLSRWRSGRGKPARPNKTQKCHCSMTPLVKLLT